ncbi:MAG TPA: P-loop NTPase [Armatimonadota bacterium]|nr:P-loop NTPase [Armatimonadota bacterium]
MKIAVAGKGGVGKTTLTAALAHAFARQGRAVMAVDADPNNCLGPALGFPDELVAAITPICEMRELLCERAGTSQGGGFFAINPEVDDLIERFSVRHDGIRLLVMGTITSGGSGCACPESSVLRALTREIVTGEESVLLLDMEAGLEHLGRGTSRYMDALLIVVEPTQASTRTAERIAALARDLGLERLFVVANKVRATQDAAFIRDRLSLPLIGHLPLVEGLGWVGRAEPSPEFLAAVDSIKARLETELAASDAQPRD